MTPVAWPPAGGLAPGTRIRAKKGNTMSDTAMNPTPSAPSPVPSNPGALQEALSQCIEEGAKAPTPREGARRALACMLGHLLTALADDSAPPAAATSPAGPPAGEPAAHMPATP